VSAYPRFLPVCNPSPARDLPKGPQWLYEPKLDGWRCQAVKAGPRSALYTRRGKDLAGRLPPIAAAVAALPCRSATLDGELVMTRADGTIDFHGLFGAAGRNCEGVAYWAFDILELDGEVLRELPLIERKRWLATLIARARSDRLRLIDHFDDGAKLLTACAEAGLEGVVAKLREAPYRSGPSRTWVKIKCPVWRESNRDRHELFAR
jgi:bifunctional non-homologous end joining protein LigD